MSVVAEAPDLLAPALRRVIAAFDEEIRSDLPFVTDLTRRIQGYRGKLLRPRLLLLTGQACGELRREHIVLAAVVEMVHMATLVHDDVLDEADVRRRGPTLNRLIGNEGAVLLGDFLISHAYHLCSGLGSTDYSRRVAAATNVVCEGELMQIAHRGDFELGEGDYLEIIRRKTAALTSLCCDLGARVSGASPERVDELAAFGEELGMAFQIVDDLLDLGGAAEDAGKTLGRDADLGKLTLPGIRFLARANADQRARLLAILTRGAVDRTGAARELLADSDAADYAMDVARRFIDSAKRRLESLPDSDAKDALLAAADFILARNR